MGRPKNFTRAAVLDKTIPVFWKQGYADTSMADLEKATGVNKSGLYAEFKDKEDLFLASLLHYQENRGARHRLLAEPPGWDNVESFLGVGQVERWGLTGCFSVCSLRELDILPEQARALVMAGRERLRQLLLVNVQAASPRGDAARLTDMIYTFFNGLCLEHSLPSEAASAPGKIATLMEILRAL